MGLALTIPPSAGAAGIAQAAGASSPAAPGASNGFATLLAETASQSPDAPAADLLAQLLAEQHGRGNGLATALAAVGNEEHPEETPAEDSTTLDIVLPASAAIDAPAAPAVAQSAAANVPASAPAATPWQVQSAAANVPASAPAATPWQAQSAAANVPAGVPAAMPPQAQANDEAAPATAPNLPQQAAVQAQASTGPPTLPANASSVATDHAAVETPRLGRRCRPRPRVRTVQASPARQRSLYWRQFPLHRRRLKPSQPPGRLAWRQRRLTSQPRRLPPLQRRMLRKLQQR